jgi:hypothetical protein
LVKKKNKQTNKQKTKKQQTYIQWKQKTKAPPQKKAPPQVWWSFKTFGIWWECFLILLFILTKQLYYSNSVWNISNYLGIKSVYNLIHVMHTYTLHDEYEKQPTDQ